MPDLKRRGVSTWLLMLLALALTFCIWAWTKFINMLLDF